MRLLCWIACAGVAACQHAERGPEVAPPTTLASPSVSTPSFALEGTRWMFCPEVPTKDCVKEFLPGRTQETCVVQKPLQGTLTFHPDGVAEILGLDRLPACAKAHWSQSGDRVAFDCNGFTEYEVRIRGDKMIGGWRQAARPPAQPTTRVVVTPIAPVMPLVASTPAPAHGDACLMQVIERAFTPPNVEGTAWRTCGGGNADPGSITVTFQPGGAASFERNWFNQPRRMPCDGARWTQEAGRVAFDCSLDGYDLQFIDGGIRLLGEVENALWPGRKRPACFEKVDR